MSDQITVNLPGGGKAHFPAGTPPQEIEAALSKLGAPSAGGEERSFLQRAGNYAKGALKAAGQGLTLGYADEIGSAIDATLPGRELISKVRPISQAENWQQRYDENLNRERGEAKQFSQENPGTATAANVAGNVAGAYALSGAPVVGALFRGGPGLVGNVAKGAAGGAALGGAQGFGEGEGGFENRIKSAALPAAIGGALGAALPAAGSGAGYAYEKFAPRVMDKAAALAEKLAPRVAPASLSAAAPEGGQITQAGLAADLADALRSGSANIEGDAATKRLALELSRSGGTGQARAALDDMGEGAFLAGTSKGATRLANVGNMMPGDAADKYAAAYTARNAETGKRFLGAMGEHANAPGVSRFDKFFEGYKSGKGAEIYDPVLRANGGKLNVTPEIEALMERPSIKKALETVDGWAAEEGQALTQAERLHMVKQALNKNAETAMNSGSRPVNKKMVDNTAGEWEAALYQANPAIQEADTAYAKIASLPEWRDRGLNFMKKGYGEPAVASSAEALADELPHATAQQATAASVGTSNVMADAARGGAKSTRRLADALIENSDLQAKLGTIYKSDPAMVSRTLKQSGTELKFAKEAQDVLGGSHTGQRVASLSDELGLSITPSASPASIFQMLATGYQKMRQPSEGVRSRLADLLANPDPAANAETLALVDALLKRQSGARPFSAGIAGSAGGSFSNP